MIHFFKAAGVIFLIGLLTWTGLQLHVEIETILWLILASVVVIGFVTLERQSREIRSFRKLLENHDSSKFIRGGVSSDQNSR